MNRKICNQPKCDRTVLAKDLCNMHYKRLYRGKDIGDNKPLHINHGYTSRDKSKEHPLYKTWETMRARCNNPNRREYKNYGGRGIRVCKRWDNFALFIKDMGERPTDTTLDRINVNGNYTPKNCRWADRITQRNNQRKVR